MALATRGLDKPISLTAPALGVNLQLPVGLAAKPLGQRGRLGPDLGKHPFTLAPGSADLILGGSARVGDDPFSLCARIADDCPRPFVGRPNDFRGGRLGACLVEQLGCLALRLGPDRFGLPSRLSHRPFSMPHGGFGAQARALEHALGFKARALDPARQLGLPGGHGTLALPELHAPTRECAPDLRAGKPLAHKLEVAINLIGVIAAPHPAEAALHNEHRQRLPSRGHMPQFRSTDAIPPVGTLARPPPDAAL